MIDLPLEAEFHVRLGRNIAQKRKDQKLSRRKVGDTMGVHRNVIMQWEKGQSIKLWDLLRLASAIDVQWFMLLPPPEMIWGEGLDKLREQESLKKMRKTVQSERDPRISKTEEVALKRAVNWRG